MTVKETCFDLITRGYRKLFARTWWYPWNKLLFNLSLRGLGILNEERGRVISSGEVGLLQKLAAQWGPSPTVLDVGAHHGEYASFIKQLATQATVYAFEPHPSAFALLQAQASRCGYVAVNCACGDKTGEANLYDYAEHQGSVHASLYPAVITSLHKGQPASVSARVIALDDFIREHGIQAVDLLKIDTEGHELNVLAGMQAALAKNAVDVVQFEFNAMNVMSRVFCRDFYAALPQYDLYRLLPDGLVPLGEYQPVLCEIFGYQNVVAIRKGCGKRL